MKIRQDLISYVFSKSDLENASEIPLDKSLLTEGILDSLGILELCEYIEEHFHIKIEDEDFTEDTLGSIKKMENYISNKLS
tara:strand:- start:3986 stop:4228 length:243 start_codon:yes stop_codon:yes gene_type:complete